MNIPVLDQQIGASAPHIPARRSHTNYVLATGGCLLALLTLFGLINVSIDPYLRFGTKRIRGWNEVKPAVLSQVRMAKAYEVQRRPYKTLLLGNSRVDVGLDPVSKSIPDSWQPVYNLGQPGTGTDTSLVYLKHACTNHPPARVVIGVDFMNFLRSPSNQSTPLPEITDEPLSPGNDLTSAGLQDSQWERFKRQTKDAVTAGLSLSALSDSVRTLMAQRRRYSPSMSEQGFNSGEAFRTLIADEGQLALFDQKNREYADRCVRRIADFESSKEMDSIHILLATCNASNIQADVFIHPYHVDVLEIVNATDKWLAFEDWKRRIVVECEQNGARLWDFSGYNQWTMEKPPPAADRTTVMSWYWESGHYRSTLGDLVLAKIFGNALSSSPGQQLSTSNIEEQLQTIREQRDLYAQTYPDRHARIQEIVSTLRAR